MYPFLRLAHAMWKVRGALPLGLLEAHVSTVTCWPWDLDPWVELNNGRTLTLFDLGRLPLGHRIGLHRVLRERQWGLTVAGSSIRYRRRVRAFERVTMVSRGLGWDNRFLYIEQSMWKGAEAASQVLIRSAFTSRAGIVPPADVVSALGHDPVSPPLPDWVAAWVAAEAQRPWPPEAGPDGAGRVRATTG